MSRGASNKANQLYSTDMGVGKAASDRSGALFGTLNGMFGQEASNPQGFSPKDLTSMNTASQQSVGGATAGAKGEGDLMAARTRNSAGYAPALDESVRGGERTLSENALGVQKANALLKQHQSEIGQRGLESLYDTNNSSLMQSLGLANGAVDSGIKAGQSGWFQNMISMINALKPGYSSGGGASFGG